jgi:long-subunit acyl-CoA synthetase (AMP-forming)
VFFLCYDVYRFLDDVAALAETSTERAVSFLEAKNITTRIGQDLLSKGIGKGKVVPIAAPNSLNFSMCDRASSSSSYTLTSKQCYPCGVRFIPAQQWRS